MTRLQDAGPAPIWYKFVRHSSFLEKSSSLASAGRKCAWCRAEPRHPKRRKTNAPSRACPLRPAPRTFDPHARPRARLRRVRGRGPRRCRAGRDAGAGRLAPEPGAERSPPRRDRPPRRRGGGRPAALAPARRRRPAYARPSFFANFTKLLACM